LGSTTRSQIRKCLAEEKGVGGGSIVKMRGGRHSKKVDITMKGTQTALKSRLAWRGGVPEPERVKNRGEGAG